MTQLRLSVVMPTHNRAGLLPATLRALNAQTIPSDEYEVILVADGCQDDTARVVAGIRPELAYALHFIEQPGAGAAAARNRGVELARAPLILFLDDDMDPAPSLIEAHLAEHAERPGALVLGYFPIPFGPVRDDPFAGPARDWWDAGFAQRRQPGYRFDFRDFCTGNISVPADLFRQVGGFYQRIGGAGGEDWELGYRLLRLGAKFRFAKDALSHHQDFNSLDRALRRSHAEGLAHAQTILRHIELAWCFNLHRLSRLQAFPYIPLWRLMWKHPEATDVAATLLKTAVVTARRLGFVSLMYRLHRVLAGYMYWRGVNTSLRSLAVWEQLMQDAPLEPEDVVEVDIDLAKGSSALERAADAGADSVRLWWNTMPVGRIAPTAGAERLSAVHIRDAATQAFAGSLLDKAPVPQAWRPMVDAQQPTGIAPDAPDSTFECTCVVQFDLLAPDHVWGLQRFDSVQLLATANGHPSANLLLKLRPGTAVLSSSEVLLELQRRGLRWDPCNAPSQPATQVPISVVVCAGRRPHALRRCLRALSDLRYANFEVVVVDDAPLDGDTARIVAATPFRYLGVEHPGVNWARNRAIAECRHDIIAYVDVGAVVVPDWLGALCDAFADSRIAAVTGPVLAAELSFPAQRAFARYRGTVNEFARRDFPGADMTAAQKIAAHCAGTGANMALRRDVVEQVGRFDPAMDRTTSTSDAGALDFLHRVLVAGLTIRHEPRALAWQRHWRDIEKLRQQLYGDGRAFGVYLLKIWRHRSVPRRSALRYALVDWLGAGLLGQLVEATAKRDRLSIRLALAELWGAAHAPWVAAIAHRADRGRPTSTALPSGPGA